jgi:uncharacterized membrane protein
MPFKKQSNMQGVSNMPLWLIAVVAILCGIVVLASIAGIVGKVLGIILVIIGIAMFAAYLSNGRGTIRR